MTLPVVSLLLFLTLALALAALALGARDLLFARGASGAVQTTADAGPVRLRRLPRAADEQPAHGPVAGFDRWFSQLVRQTGLPMSTMEAALVLVLCGVALGAAALVYSEHPLAATLGAVFGMCGALVAFAVGGTVKGLPGGTALGSVLSALITGSIIMFSTLIGRMMLRVFTGLDDLRSLAEQEEAEQEMLQLCRDYPHLEDYRQQARDILRPNLTFGELKAMRESVKTKPKD